MISDPTQLLRISQAHLNLLESCPRQFQHTYLEQLYSPLPVEHEVKQILGSRFHLLMQQREMGLPIDSFLAANPQLQTWMDALTNAAPEILTASLDSDRDSEHYRTLQIQNYLLTVVYDLLITNSTQAQIFDWKTYVKPPNKVYLERNWQTKLYLYVLAETSDYIPENISMTYWFILPQGEPQSVKFNYTQRQHQQTALKLNALLSQLSLWLEAYHNGVQFPQIPPGSTCNHCQFDRRCQRHESKTEETISSGQVEPIAASNLTDANLLNVASIQEVSL